MTRAAMLVLAVGWVGVAAPAGAKTRLAVVELAAPPNLSGIADKLAQDIVDVARRDPKLAVVTPLEAAATLGPESLKNLKACGGRPGCITSHGKALMVDRLVVGSLDRTENSYLVKLFLIEVKSSTVVATVDRSILIASRRLQGDVAAAIPGLLRGEAEARGKLAVSTSKAGATVLFDGDVAGKTPLTLEAKPGKHTLKVAREGFLPVERFVNVTAGTTETVTLTLTPIPGVVQEEEVPVPQKPQGTVGTSASSTGYTVPAASWVLGGLAVAAAGTGTYFAVTTSQAASKAGSGPVYAITREEALAGKRDALVANVCFGVAGAAAVTAVLLGVLLPQPAPQAAAPQASLAPIPGGAALSLSGSF